MTTQSIIVYRNPLEAALWEGQFAEYLVPVGGACLVALVAFLIANRLGEAVVRKLGGNFWRWQNRIATFSAVCSFAAFAVTVNALWIK